MTLCSSKTGILSIVNILIALIIIGCIANEGIQTEVMEGISAGVKGTYPFNSFTSAVSLLVIACSSFIFHIVAIISTFLGDEPSILKTKMFQLKQIVITLVYFGSSVTILVYTELYASAFKKAGADLPKPFHVYRAASSFGIIGALTHGATAFLAFKGL